MHSKILFCVCVFYAYMCVSKQGIIPTLTSRSLSHTQSSHYHTHTYERCAKSTMCAQLCLVRYLTSSVLKVLNDSP